MAQIQSNSLYKPIQNFMCVFFNFLNLGDEFKHNSHKYLIHNANIDFYLINIST